MYVLVSKKYELTVYNYLLGELGLGPTPAEWDAVKDRPNKDSALDAVYWRFGTPDLAKVRTHPELIARVLRGERISAGPVRVVEIPDCYQDFWGISETDECEVIELDTRGCLARLVATLKEGDPLTREHLDVLTALASPCPVRIVAQMEGAEDVPVDEFPTEAWYATRS